MKLPTPKIVVLPEQNKVIAILYTKIGKFRATAKCGPNDTWDEERGIALATARVMLKHASRQTFVLNKLYAQKILANQVENNKVFKELSKIAEKNNAYMDSIYELREQIEQLST